MAADECKRIVTTRCSGVECEMCELWFYTACVGLSASTKMLRHKNIMFLCDKCLHVAKEKLKTRKEDMVAKETKTMAVVSSIKDVQTQDVKYKNTGCERLAKPRRQGDANGGERPSTMKRASDEENDQEEVLNLHCWGQHCQECRFPPQDQDERELTGVSEGSQD